MGKLHITQSRVGDSERLSLSGAMDEGAGVQLLTLFESVGKRCSFNLAGVESVNSRGTAVWMDFMRSFREGRSVTLEECAPCFVDLLNMIPSISVGITIASVLTPWYCACGSARQLRLVSLDRPPYKLASLLRAPRCVKCKEQMQLSANEEDFFEFAISTGVVTVE